MLHIVKKINTGTGEIVSEERKSFGDIFDEEKGYLFWNRKSFVKIFQEVELPDELSKMEIANLYLLTRKVYSNTNMLAYRGNGGIKPMQISHVAKVIRDTERRTTTFINRMIKLRIIAKVNVEIGDDVVTQYYLNPIYFFSSNRLTLNLYLLFQQDLDHFLPDWVKLRFKEINS